MASGPPLIRASYAKTVIGGIKRQPDAVQQRLFASIGADVRREIRDYGMLEWMPAARFAELVDAIRDVLGPEDAQSFWRANLLLSLERRLLSPLRLGAIALHGNSPRSLLKMTPQAWELVSKDCGTCRVEDRPPSGVLLRFEGLPEELCVPGMLMLWAGGCESCVERMKFEGAQADGGFGPLRSAEIGVTWKLRG